MYLPAESWNTEIAELLLSEANLCDSHSSLRAFRMHFSSPPALDIHVSASGNKYKIKININGLSLYTSGSMLYSGIAGRTLKHQTPLKVECINLSNGQNNDQNLPSMVNQKGGSRMWDFPTVVCVPSTSAYKVIYTWLRFTILMDLRLIA